MKDIIRSTPYEEYSFEDVVFTVKRDDLCSSITPSSSKVRGMYPYLTKVLYAKGENAFVGVADTYRECKSGAGIAHICDLLGLKPIIFIPTYAREEYEGNPYQLKARSKYGARLEYMQAGRMNIMYYQARKRFMELTKGQGEMVPSSISLQETIDGVAEELLNTAPGNSLKKGSWVVSVGSGTVTAGVMKGLAKAHSKATVYGIMSYTASVEWTTNHIWSKVKDHEGQVDLEIIDPGWVRTQDPIDSSHVPFPCNPLFDVKSWNWMLSNIHQLETPITFWNVGA